ncbi:MAG TPA: YbaK/EbsC family protein, partial [Anaerovoracaceae bacterium]|nr:YbaK/EbsC family protein [Anaerovoracaceae bacterium]
MSIEKVREFFKQFNKDNDILEFDTSSATVELAAAAAGVIPARIAKTLSFYDKDGCVLVVTAGDRRIDNGKFKKTFNMKARMLSPDKVL